MELEVGLDLELELEINISSDSCDVELSPLEILETPWLDVAVALETDSPPKTLVSSFCPKTMASGKRDRARIFGAKSILVLSQLWLSVLSYCEAVAHLLVNLLLLRIRYTPSTNLTCTHCIHAFTMSIYLQVKISFDDTPKKQL